MRDGLFFFLVALLIPLLLLLGTDATLRDVDRVDLVMVVESNGSV